MIKKVLLASLISGMILGCEAGYAGGAITLTPTSINFPGIQCVVFQAGAAQNPCGDTEGVVCVNTASGVNYGLAPVLKLQLNRAFTANGDVPVAPNCHILSYPCTPTTVTQFNTTYSGCGFCPDNSLKVCASNYPNTVLQYNIRITGAGGEAYNQGTATVENVTT